VRSPGRDRVLSIALIAPSIVAVGIFVYGLIGWTAFVSTTNWNDLLPDYSFAGLANFANIFDNPRFQIDLRNTTVFTICFGATELRVFRHVVLPLLTPVTISAVIILGHISLKIYDLTVAMSPIGPGFGTDVPANFMWTTAFNDNQFARGAAVAIVMLVLVAIVIVPYLVWTRRREIER
jgi:ABC-type sugar transport system permease subunit